MNNSDKLASKLSRKNQAKKVSKYRGVYWNDKLKKWFCQLQIGKKYIYGGVFITEREAAKEYDVLATEHLDLPILNFPPKINHYHSFKVIVESDTSKSNW